MPDRPRHDAVVSKPHDAAGRELRISVVIPTKNEAVAIGATLDAVLRGRPHEVIVVDGGSDDDTLAIAQSHGAATICAEAGRGVQLDAGASHASGDVVLFLHADTLLPDDYTAHVRDAMRDGAVVAGAFRLRVDLPGPSMRLIERAANWRSRVLGLPYGDQAVFVRAQVLRDVEGVPHLPIMEDFVLARRLRREGRIAIAPADVVTSGRRWKAAGVWRMTAINLACVAAWYLRVSPHRIARWRQRASMRARREHAGDASPTREAHDAPLA